MLKIDGAEPARWHFRTFRPELKTKGTMLKHSAMRMVAAASRAISTSPAAKSTYTGGFDVFNQQSRILVTGGTGQIGRFLSATGCSSFMRH